MLDILPGENFLEFLTPGLRISVLIPHQGETIHDTGVILSILQDLVKIRFSYSQTGEDPGFSQGETITIQITKDGRGYSLRCLVVLHPSDGLLTVRVISGAISDELREFYRLDVFIPLIHFPLGTSKLGIAEALWKKHAALSISENTCPVAANLSGGGVRLSLLEKLHKGEMVGLFFVLKTDTGVKRLSAIAEVVYVKQISGTTEEMHMTALKFVSIKEQHRDLLIGYLNQEQMKSIVRKTIDHHPAEKQPSRRVAWLIILAVTVMILSLVWSRTRGEKNEIDKNFSRGISEIKERQAR